jgi:hypothetical protein
MPLKAQPNQEGIKAWQGLEPRRQDFALKPSSEGESARRLAELGGAHFAAMQETGFPESETEL